MSVSNKKKVLIFIPQFPTLTETFIEREVSKLVERNNLDIVVLSLKQGKGSLSEESESVVVYKRLDYFSLLLGLFYLLFRFSKYVEAYKLLKENRTFFQRIYIFIKSLGYARIFSRYKPDIIYAHFLSESSTIGLLASKILDVDFAISAHARDVFENADLVPEKVDSAKFITVCNKRAWEKTVELSNRPETKKVHLVYHGVDPKKLVKRKGLQVKKPDIPLIFCVARLVEKKGIYYLIEASRILKERGILHRVYVAGPGPLYKSLNSQVRESHLEEHFVLLGGIPFKNVLLYLKACDVFALPSINIYSGDADGVPNVLVEAALLKVPIVTTDAGSITDLITDNETGILVSQRDATSLADALERLFFDLETRKKLGKKAFAKAKEMFDLDTNVSKIEKLLIED